MSPFKEPQPRKKAPGASEPGVNPWPPYAREGGEANWAAEVKPSMKDQIEVPNTPEAAKFQEAINAAITEAQWTMTDTEFNRELETAREEGRAEVLTDLDYRKAALEAALTHAKNLNLDNSAQGITLLADIFENYLRNGKPS